MNKTKDYIELSAEEKEIVKKNSFQHRLFSAYEKVLGGSFKCIVVPRHYLRLCQNTGSEGVVRFEKRKSRIHKKTVVRKRQTNDLATAIFLSYLTYLDGKGHRDDGFIWKSATQWKEEAGLTPHQMRQAIAWCVKKGYVEVKLHKVSGRDTNHFRLNQEKLTKSIAELVAKEINESNFSEETATKAINRAHEIFKSNISQRTYQNDTKLL